MTHKVTSRHLSATCWHFRLTPPSQWQDREKSACTVICIQAHGNYYPTLLPMLIHDLLHPTVVAERQLSTTSPDATSITPDHTHAALNAWHARYQGKVYQRLKSRRWVFPRRGSKGDDGEGDEERGFWGLQQLSARPCRRPRDTGAQPRGRPGRRAHTPVTFEKNAVSVILDYGSA